MDAGGRQTEELDRLEAEAVAKRDAVRQHLHHAVAVWRDGGKVIGTADTVVDRESLERYDRLKAEADKADAEVLGELRGRARG
jgi:hypothetical protein